jgi:DNA-binding NtrC family response regulator
MAVNKVRNIMVVEKRPGIAKRLERQFAGRRVTVASESNVDAILDRFEVDVYDVVIITSAAVQSGHVEGKDLFEAISGKSPTSQVLFLVDPAHIKLAMKAMTAGSFRYAKFPIEDDELRMLVDSTLKEQGALEEASAADGAEPVRFDQPLLGRSKPMKEVFRQISQAAASDIPVLILGETGTGKDLAAQAIHLASDRGDGPYVPVHLGALPQELVASELFGHEKGAFTGALDRRSGKFEQASTGTIFLDEISTIDERVQISLLRILESKRFTRLGGKRVMTTRARIIAATNENPSDLVGQGSFREDLLYRLDVFRILMPPLRDRQGDIPLLIDAFMKRFRDAFHKDVHGIHPECVAQLEDHDWPGNVRELKNVIQRAVLISTGQVLLPEHLPGRFGRRPATRPKVSFTVGTPLAEIEREMVVRALAVAPNRTQAAELLGISRRALYNKLRKYDIQ